MTKFNFQKIVVISFLVFGGSCQTSPSFFRAPVSDFKIQKLSESGLIETRFQSNESEWPTTEVKKLDQGLAVNSQMLRMAIIGDTGCRLKESNGKASYQNCHLEKEWPYPQIAQKLLSEKVDFIIHTGDYHYREQCSDPKKCPAIANHIGYGWGAWWDDFYGPSQDLFKSYPFLFVRGNHEDCQRAYQGFNPLSVLNKNFIDSCEKFDEIQLIEIGDLVLINFDDSAFEDRKPLSDQLKSEWVARLKKTLDRVQGLVGRKEIWLLTHMPVYGFVPDSSDAEPFAITQNLKSVLSESGLLSKISYVLSGHIHNQQIVMDQKDLLQFIVGHSGSSLDSFGRKIMNNKIITTTETKQSFGYAIFERQGFKKWNLIFKNTNGDETMKCSLIDQKVNCEFTNH